jgi:hypothetical protein
MVAAPNDPVKAVGPYEQCSHGPEPRRHADGRCAECQAARTRAYYRRNAEAIKAKRRAEYHADPTAAKLERDVYYEQNAPKIRATKRKMWRRAAMVGCPPEPAPFTPCRCGDAPKHLQADHDHTTGLFRGWLCRNCNSTLGMAKDSVARLQMLIQYIQETR